MTPLGGSHATPAEREALAAGVCAACGRADDNLSTLARCWPCIRTASSVWEAKVAAHREQHRAAPECMALARKLADERQLPIHSVMREAERDYEAAQSRRAPVPVSRDPRRRLQGLLRTVNDATEGTRNATLHWSACRVGEMVLDGVLPDGRRAAEALAAVALGTGLDPSEVHGTIRSGFATSGVIP